MASAKNSSDGYPDEAILERLRAGDREMFGPLVKRYEHELYGYLRRYLGDDELASDVFQNTFIAVFRKIKQYEPGRPARPWLYAIATNQAIDALRRVKRRNERTADSLTSSEDGADNGKALFDLLAARDPDPALNAQSAEVALQVRTIVEGMPDLLRHVIVLAYFQGMKYQEIAELLEIPLGTVKSRLNAAMTKFAEAWHAQTQNHDKQ